MAVAMRQEVHTGKAVIRTTISGDTPVEYEISIERVSLSEQNPTRNMVIRITDPRLLSATGGIVQGMSRFPPSCKTANWSEPSPMCWSTIPPEDTGF